MSLEFKNHQLIWLYPGFLERTLDAATWLDTTNELRKMEWEIILVSAGPFGERLIGDTRVFSIPLPNIYLLRQLIFHLGFYWFLLRNGSRASVLLFDQTSSPWFIPVRLVRSMMQKTRPLLVIDIRSLHMPSPNKQGMKDWFRGKFQEFFGGEAYRWVDGYVTITARMAKEVRVPTNLLWGTWPSGVNLELFKNLPKARPWPMRDDSVRLIYVGSLFVERNLMALCRAAERANSSGMSFELWLVGKGDEQSDLEKFATQTQGRIKVIPSVPHDQIPHILSQAHVGVLPFPDEIKFQVSSPIKLFEYMAAAMPILATRIGCHTDVVGDGNYVFWAESGDESGLLDALRLVWQGRENLERMGSQAFAAASEWTWKESAMKLKQSLEYGLKRNFYAQK